MCEKHFLQIRSYHTVLKQKWNKYPSAHFDSRWNFNVDKFQRFLDVFSTLNKKTMKYRRRINVEISTTVEISTKYTNVFQRFFDVHLTLNQLRKCPLGYFAILAQWLLKCEGNNSGLHIRWKTKMHFFV